MQVLVVGLGRFGSSFAKRMKRYGNEVVAVDVNEKLVEDIEPFVSEALVMDATDMHALKEIAPWKFDYVVVCIGDNLTASILTVMNLKELGVKYVVAKANSEIQAKILEKLGVQLVVYPEDETAERLAMKLSVKDVIEYYEVFRNLSIAEVKPPEDVINRTLKESRIRNRYNVYVVAIRRANNIIVMPSPEERIYPDDTIVVMGNKEDIRKL